MLLLFRMGDFYESFDDDARSVAKLLGLALMTRDKQIPMAGFPHHQLENYLAKLLQNGQRVAVCDQVEPSDRPGEVSRIVSPGAIAADPDAAKREELNAIARDAAERLGLLLVFLCEWDLNLPTMEVFGDDAEKLAPLIPVELHTANGIRWVELAGEHASDNQDALHAVSDFWLTWDTADSEAENWHEIHQACKEDEEGELPAGFKIEEPLTTADLTPSRKPAKVRPCLRCGSGLQAICPTCKMCSPCCWCPKN